MDTEELKARIRDAVQAGRTNYKTLSKAIGRNDTYVQQFVTKNVPSELRERDERTILALIGPAQHPPSQGFAPQTMPGHEVVGDRSLPVYAAAMGGDGHEIVSFEAIDFVKRPTFLENVRDAYAMYIVGESMAPAFEPGDMALVHPHLPPARGKNVVLFHVPPSGEAECIVKRLVAFTDRDWILQQYNPAREFREARADWPYCHRIVGKYEAR